jgi:small subunit ribosomal protein S1
MTASELRSQVDGLYTKLVEIFDTAAADVAANVDECRELSTELCRTLRNTEWDDDLLEPLRSVIVLLEHAGASVEANVLRVACRDAAPDASIAQGRFDNLGLVIARRTGKGGWFHGDPMDLPESNRPGGPIEHFALASLAFDQHVFAARLSEAKIELGRLEQHAESIMTELGADHPYLGQVLLTLASAKCGLAAVEGNIQDLRRYAEVLAIAVQRASAQLGPDHVLTIGGQANLANIEFEIALASRSPREVAECVDNLFRLERHSRRICGQSHPTVVILTINAAVASLESARQARSISQLETAERRLIRAAQLAEESFGASHPCTAIARSNAASAGFDLARAQRSRPRLEQMVGVLEDAVSQVSDSLGAGHATARALTRQLSACRRLLASDNPWADERGGGTATIVRTVEDELWGLDDDYVPVYEASPPRRHPPGSIPDQGAEEDFLAAIDKAIKYFNDGDIVEGTVAEVRGDEVLVDIGYKTRGVIPAQELSIKQDVDPAEIVRVGDEVEALVLRKEDEAGRLVLSKVRAQYQRAWGTIEELKEADEPVSGTVVEVVKGGLILDVGVRGFLPASLVERRRVRNLQPYLGHQLAAKILELDRNRNQVVLSRRALLETQRLEAERELLEQLEKGQIRKGVVASIVNFGAFVDLGGVDGLVHTSELSWKEVSHPSEVVAVGQEVMVEVLHVDLERGRVTLSIRATQPDPWHRFARNHPLGQTVSGTVTKLVPFGAFVRVDDGIEGLIHISELAWEPVGRPEQVVRVGDQIEVKIVDIDLQRRRISLSLKQATPSDAAPNPNIPDPDEQIAALRERARDDS